MKIHCYNQNNVLILHILLERLFYQRNVKKKRKKDSLESIGRLSQVSEDSLENIGRWSRKYRIVSFS